MKIVQISSVIMKGEALSNIIRCNDKIFKEEGYDAIMLADLFSEVPNVPTLIFNDFVETPKIITLFYFFERFIRLTNKMNYIKKMNEARKTYFPGLAKSKIQEADIRIWHYGASFTSFKYIRRNDIISFYGITDPYLSGYPEFAIHSKQELQATADLDPTYIVESKFILNSLRSLGIKNKAYVLYLFHTYDLPYQKHQSKELSLLAYGRYAKNKAIPELAKFCQTNNIRLSHFGDNSMNKEFQTQFKEAQQYNFYPVDILPKQPEIDSFFWKANIYICNSYHEGFNMGIVEAYAHSLPVLARRGTAMDEIVVNGITGFLYSDIAEVPELAREILANYEFFSKNAYEESKKYTYKIYKKNLLKIINEYLGK
jgi:glycosyltransferase involved in cell wall biosynthesis